MTDPEETQQDHIPASGLQAVFSAVTAGMKTLGGLQLWGDTVFLHGWRVQQNVLNGHYRLLDPADRRHISGTRAACEQKLDEIRRRENLPPMSGRAVLLIHGLGRTSKCFSRIAKLLRDDGYTVVGFDYPSTRLPIQNSADYLYRVILSLHGITSIDVVCHSMGGLVLRSCLSRYDDSRLGRAVLLGVPNKGAQLADALRNNSVFRLLLGPGAQQLVTDADGLIPGLAVPRCEFGILAGGRGGGRGYNPLLPGDNDSTVTIESTRLNGAADFLRLPVIHSFLMSDSTAIQATLCFLRHGRFQQDRPPEPVSAGPITVVS